ncbi:hypothetical protein EV2_023211 [Malus domestica]
MSAGSGGPSGSHWLKRRRRRRRLRVRLRWTSPALLLILLVLKVPHPLNLLNNANLHDLPLEPAEQPLLGLVVVDNHLHIVRRLEEEDIGVS